MIRITLFNNIGDVDKLAFTPDNLVDITWDDELIQTLLISNRSQFKMADAADDAKAIWHSKQEITPLKMSIGSVFMPNDIVEIAWVLPLQ